MKCRRAQDLITPYLDADLPPGEREALERHVAECDACAKELASLRTTVELVRGLPDAIPPKGLSGMINRKLDEPAPPVNRVSWKRRLWPAAAAAAVALVLHFAAPDSGRRPAETEPAPPSEPAEQYLAGDPFEKPDDAPDSEAGVLSERDEAEPPPALTTPPDDAPFVSLEAAVRAADPESARDRVRRLGVELGLEVEEREGGVVGVRGEARRVRALVERLRRAGLDVGPAGLADTMPREGWVELAIRTGNQK